MKKLFTLIGIALVSSMVLSCKDDATTTTQFTLDINGLENLGGEFVYEGWLIVGGSPITTGTFTVEDNGNLSNSSFTVDISNLDNASAFVLTIEPSNDPDPEPSDVHILAGDLTNGVGILSVGHAAALGDDYSTAAGGYILATPTNGTNNDENSGIWFLDPAAGPGVGLTLPTLPAGWKYEGWSVINGVAVSTGKFTALNTADEQATFSGPILGPPFPGEDFLVNAPTELTFPVDLSGSKAVISIEPEPDNSGAPFLLKPLVGDVPANAADHTFYSMGQNLSSLPSGTVLR